MVQRVEMKCILALLVILPQILQCTFGYDGEAKFTFIYIVGVEGAGHYGLKEVLEILSHLTGHRVLWRGPAGNRGFRDALWFTPRDKGYALRKYIVNDTDGVLNNPHGGGFMDKQWEHTVIIEHASFPFERDCRKCGLEGIENAVPYKIHWWYKTFFPLIATNEMKMKLLYIERNWWDTIVSHKNFAVPMYDGDMRGHATVIGTYLKHIWNEYSRIKEEFPDRDDFRGLHYEWFASHFGEGYSTVKCKDLIEKMFDFLEFKAHTIDEEVIAESCRTVAKMWHKPKIHERTHQDYAFAMSLKHDYIFPMLPVNFGNSSSEKQRRVRDRRLNVKGRR